MSEINSVGSVKVIILEVVQPLSSKISTVYVPAITPSAVSSASALLHKYVYGAVPPVGETIASPSAPLKQLIFVPEIVEDKSKAGSVKVISSEI